MQPPTGRRPFLKSAAAAAAALALGRLGANPSTRRRRNVLFIAVDDLRPQLRCYGHREMVTPHLDALADSGCLFERAYCPQAICSPARTSVLTGLRPDTVGVHDLETHFRNTYPGAVTLQQSFMLAGYRVEGMGKVFHGRLNDQASWHQWHDVPGGGYVLASNIARQRERRAAATARGLSGVALTAASLAESCEDPAMPDDAFGDYRLAEAASHRLALLRDRREPFFLGVGFIKPHLPFVAPRHCWNLYDPAALPIPQATSPLHGVPSIALHDSQELRTYEDVPDSGPIAESLFQRLRHGYYASVSHVDSQIGRVLDAVDALGLRESTVVVLWADHGYHLGENGLWCKHTNFDAATRVPLLIRAPGLPAGARVRSLVESVDLYPTLSELCGVAHPRELEGTSLVPLLGDPALSWKGAVFSQYPRGTRDWINCTHREFMGYTMRTADHRYTEWVRLNDRRVVARELYDYKAAPIESENLAEAPGHASLSAELARRLHAGWRGERPAT